MDRQGCLLPWYGSRGLSLFLLKIATASVESIRLSAQYAQPLPLDFTREKRGKTIFLHFLQRAFQALLLPVYGSSGMSPTDFIVSIASFSLILLLKPAFTLAQNLQPPPPLLTVLSLALIISPQTKHLHFQGFAPPG
jgi:hypothetical protein